MDAEHNSHVANVPRVKHAVETGRNAMPPSRDARPFQEVERAGRWFEEVNCALKAWRFRNHNPSVLGPNRPF